ncbi:hypothetical protein [Enterobacter hormaechei]|uniref:hypothetical protein n=1 Tax=Enterobacter hormaechei TaxID=158836 RepID=UPI002A7496B3|nr:hypothetical protein [Enterobacter hormaechei]MDY3570231.1 hypothetical protein [Enterobacter hormaechei]
MNESDDYIDELSDVRGEVFVRAEVKTLHTFDDGCDWTAYLAWLMNSRRRISKKRFELPPARPQIVPSKLIPRKRARASKKPKAVQDVTDY